MDTITFEQARALATAELAGDSHDFVITSTSEHEFGWVFNYAPRKYSETGDDRYLVPGNTPIVVTRDGKVGSLGDTSMEPEDAIEEQLKAWRRTHPAR